MVERRGPKRKGQKFLDSYNPDKEGVLKKDMEAAKRQVTHAEKGKFGFQVKSGKYVGVWARRQEKKKARESGVNDTDVDSRSAHQMLMDMRSVYRAVRGRSKLQKLVRNDDSQFVFMVKELMKIESALLTAQIRAKSDAALGGSGNKVVFVVLKGLGEEDKRIGVPFERMEKIAITDEGIVEYKEEEEDGGNSGA